MVHDKHTKLELIQAQISFIPDGWKLDKVGEALIIKNNLRKPISQEVRSTIQGDYPYYGPTKIQDYISDYEQYGTYALIGEDGDHFLKYSTMSQTQFISGKCTVNNHAHIIESSAICDSEWFYVFFKHRNITNFLSRQGAGRFKLNKATLERLPLLVPPLPEQREIAKILSTWDKAISTTERLIDNSKQQKKALMQQLLTGKKRLLDDSGKPFEGEWEEVVLKDLCSKVIDNRGKTPPLSEIGLPLVEINSIVNSKYPKLSKVTKFVSPETFKTWFRNGHPERGDILVATVGSAGISALVNLDEGFGSIAQNLIAIRPNSKADSSFLYYLMNTPYYFSLVRAVVMGAVQPSLKVPHLLSFKMKIPSISEQQKIASVLSNADKEVELLEQQLADLKQEKKALMQQLLTGKRRVKVDDKEVV